MKSHVRWILRFWKGHRKHVPLLFVLTLLASGVILAYPLIFKYIIEEVKLLATEGGDAAKERIFDLVGILLLVGAGRSLRNLYPMTRAWLNSRIEMSVRRAYFEKILEKGHRFFLKFRTGDIVTRLTDDISGWPKIAWFMCSGIFRAVESFATLVICTVMMIVVDWRLGLVALTPLPIMMVVFYRVQVRLGKRMLKNQQAISTTNDLLESCYSGIRILKAYRAEKRQQKVLRAQLEERIDVELDVVRMWALMDSLWTGITEIGRVLVLAVGGFWVLDGSLSLGSMYAIWIYVDQLVRPMMDLPQLFVAGKQAFVCMDRLDELADFEKGRVDGEGGGKPVGPIRELRLEGLGFRYDESREAHAVGGVTLDVPRGRKLAILGPVGSGKSTLARILCGELAPTAGRVSVNGESLADLDLEDYRRRVGYIPQEALLFSDTVRENVAFGREVADDRVLEALSLAQMEREVEAFPNRLEELLGQRGVRVSGGQRQRLAIARALAGRPELIIMDDVTAALDAENEEELWDALEARHPDLTSFIVTHRLATAKRADEILVMDRGRPVDRGTYDELMARCALFRRLAHEDSDEA